MGLEPPFLSGTLPPRPGSHPMSSQTKFQFGVYEVDLASAELRKHGLKVKLQTQPFQILALLLERPGEVVTREQIRQRLWPDDVFVDFDQGLNKAVNKLREALSDSAENPRFIETIPRRGYRFLAPVTQAGTPAAAAAPLPPPAATPAAARPATRRWLVVLAAVAVTVTAGYLAWRHFLRPSVSSLAVLPLANGSHAADLDYLGDGLTESIINNLSQLPALRVMGRNTVFHYKGREVDPRAAGRELGVSAVLTGRVTQEANQLVISVELTDVSDGTQIWGQRYTHAPSDLLTVQEEIARQVASGLQLRLSGAQAQRLTHRSTESGEAYRLYLQGRFYFNQRTPAGFVRAADFFQQAIALDPNFALGYAGLADCYGLQAFDTLPAHQYMPKARQMADHALILDPGLAEAHTSLAMVKALYEWDWAGAEDEFRRAIELNPGYATAHHWYAVHLNAMGRAPEARAQFAIARELDPLSSIINLNSAYPDHYSHQYEAAISQYKRTLALDPSFALAHQELMLVYEQQGKFAESNAEAVTTLGLQGQPALATSLASAFAAGGHSAALHQWIDALRRESETTYVSPMLTAQLYARLGDRDHAFEWLNRAFAERCAPLVYLKVDPQYDLIRNDRRFEDLTRRVGLK